MTEINKVKANITVENLDKLQKLLETAVRQSKELQKSLEAISGLELSVHTNLGEK